MTYNNTDREVKYAVENGLSGVRGKLGSIEKQVYDIQKDVDLITQIGMTIGVAAVILSILGLLGFAVLVKIMTSM